MRDSHVRSAVRQMLEERFGGDGHSRIVEEMGVWSGSVRIDVAVINGELHGYEIKSDRDTLERLPSQTALYSQVFDRMTLVAAERHIAAAANKIPNWWGIVVASIDRESIVLNGVQPSENNPSVDPLQLARLLWRAESLHLLERYGIDRGIRTGTVETMAARLSERLPLSVLKDEVRATLKARVGWLGQPISNKR